MRTHTVVRTAMSAPLRIVGASSLSLFASILVLLGYAVPALLIAVDAENTVAIAQFSPLLLIGITHKKTAFVVSGALLLWATWTVWDQKARHCPLDADEARRYRRLRHWNRWVLQLSAALWLIGIVAAFVVPSLYPPMK